MRQRGPDEGILFSEEQDKRHLGNEISMMVYY